MVRLVISVCFFTVFGLAAFAQPYSDTSGWQIELDDIIVTAQYAPTDSRNAIHDIYTIKRDVIESRGATNLEQLLQQESNIRISQDLVLGSSISLLGIDGQNVKIMIDGVPVIGRQDGNIDLSQINLHNIERVEIVEGPLSVNYGTDALGGVINLITKKSQLQRFQLGATTQIEDRGENRYTGRLGVKITEQLSIRLNGGYDVFDGFSEDTLRSVLWNPKEQWFGDAYVGFRTKKDGHLYWTSAYFDEEVQNLGEVRRPQFKPYAFDDTYLTKRVNHALAYEGPVGKSFYLQSTAGYNTFERNKQTLRTNFEEDTQEEVEGEQDTSIFRGAMLRTTLASQFSDSPFNFQVGIDFRYDEAEGQRIQDTLSGKDHFSSIEDYAVFAALRYSPVQRLQLEAGLRYAYNSRYDAPLVPSVHARYDLNKNWAVRASYGRGFRSPDLKELFFNFIDINHFIIGNPGLRAEYADNLQLGFTFLKREGNQQLSFRIKGFYNHIKDRIGLFEYIDTDEGIQPAIDTSTLRFAYFNQSTYKTQGGNLSFGYQADGLELNTALTVIGYYNDASEIFSEVDPFTYTLEISNSISYTLARYGLSFALFIRNNDQQVTFFPDIDETGASFAGQRLQDGFTMADFTITKSLWKDKIKLVAGVKNMLDIQQVGVSGGSAGAHTGSSGLAAVNPGRNFFASARIDLGW
jgi:outer membrane receptor for ferrienterochelin and colicins